MRLLDGITDSIIMSLSELRELVMNRGNSRGRAGGAEMRSVQSAWKRLPTLLCDCLCVVLISLRVMLFACLLLWQSSTWQVAVTNKCLSNASTCDHVDT